MRVVVRYGTLHGLTGFVIRFQEPLGCQSESVFTSEGGREHGTKEVFVNSVVFIQTDKLETDDASK